jgi:hypothetical protein
MLYLDDSNNLQAMTVWDMYDTFISDVISTLTTQAATTNQAGTFLIHTATSLAGCTLMDGNPIFQDTRADLLQYGNVGGLQDKPTTITNYYLFRVDAAPAGTIPQGVVVLPDNNLLQLSIDGMSWMLSQLVRYFATVPGARVDYVLDTNTFGARGSGLVNTDHIGVTGAYNVSQVGDSYRAQEFPNGTPATISTHYLRYVRT